MGSLLQQRNIENAGSLWMSFTNIENPDEVLAVHKEYIEAGADIITTNTFRTNPHAVEGIKKVNINSLVKKSVKIAFEAAKDLPVFVGGSNAPAEDCYQRERKITKKELIKNHHNHIDLLYSNGCHFILNETQSHFDEIKIICSYCSKNDIPYIISIFADDNLKVLSGENLKSVIEFVTDYNPLAVSFNCILPGTFRKIMKLIPNDFNWGFYLNCGSGSYTDEVIECGISPEDFGKEINNTLIKKPSFIGACCGSSPAHIRHIKVILDGRINN
jgi:methionine synthase I (cobalamin-dependent)